MFSAIAAQQLKIVKASDENTQLSVYIGTHPDDIDLGMSGSLFAYDLNHHPILLIVVTDGGADDGEWTYESQNQSWIGQDMCYNCSWPIPNTLDRYVTREYWSNDLSCARCGGYVADNGTWISQPASHTDPTYGTEYDWQTRMSEELSSTLPIYMVQLSYQYSTRDLAPLPGGTNENNSLGSPVTYYAEYPDGALTENPSFETSIASQIASVIYQVVTAHSYSKALLYINSHACSDVAFNYYEHPDHGVVGNATRSSINFLTSTYNFSEVDATWYTIYDQIQNKTGYSLTENDISEYTTNMSTLAKAMWETSYIDTLQNVNYTSWISFPTEANSTQTVIGVDYT